MKYSTARNRGIYCILTFILCCTFFTSRAQVPVISSIIPGSGPAGSTVKIYGSGFDPVGDSNFVYFGAAKATVLAASSQQLSVRVPNGSTHSPVTVTLSIGQTGYSTAPFSPTFSPWSNSFRFGVGSFAAATAFATGNSPAAFALADFNGDGRPDIVTANTGAATISVFRNTSTAGSISFAPRTDIASAAGPRAVCIGDFNCDGRLDVAAACSTASIISVYMNTSFAGNLSFAARTDIAAGTQPIKLAAHDMDTDGRADLAVLGHQSSVVRLFRNTGGGSIISFANTQNLNAGSFLTDIVVADLLYAVSPPEIAVISSSAGTLSVFRNNSVPGSFTFESPVNYSTGTGPAAICLVDTEMDLTNDLAVLNAGSNTIFTYRNNYFDFSAPQSIPVSGSPGAVAAFDMRGDGSQELITASQTAGTVSVLQNDSLRGYLPGVNYTTGAGPVAVAACDLDADGRPEIITVSSSTSSLSIHRNLVNETAPFISSFTPAKAATGQPVTIRGKNFTGVNAVLFGGTPGASFTVVSDTVITAQPAAGANGFVTCYTTAAYGKLPGFIYDRPAGPPRIINTIAGNGTQGYGGDGGNALNAALNRPFKLYADTAGGSFLYISDPDNRRIRRMNLTTGIITTFAGNGTQGFSGDGGPATAAQIGTAHGMAADRWGNLYFYDDNGFGRIRRIDAATGIITTIAGGGFNQADNIPATTARLALSGSMVIDKDSNLLYIADFDRVRKINLNTGIISTAAGWVFPNSNFNNSDADSIPALSARFNRIRGLAMDKNKNLYLSDNRWVLNTLIGTRIRKIDAATGIINTIAGDGTIGRDGDGGQGRLAQAGFCESLATDTSGRYLYMTQSVGDADTTANTIRMLDMQTGIITLLAGDNGPAGYSGDGGDALLAKLSSPPGLVTDSRNLIYITDNGRYVRRIAPLNTSLVLCPGGSTSISADITGATYQWQMALSDTSAFSNIVNSAQLSGGTTPTLQLTNIPSSWYGYNFRCVVNGSNGPRYQLRFENRWTGTVSTAWENPLNWSCGQVPDAGTDVYINGSSVTVSSNAVCRSLSLTGGAAVTVAPGFTLTITH